MALFGYTSSLEITVPFYSEYCGNSFEKREERRRLVVKNFSTREGGFS